MVFPSRRREVAFGIENLESQRFNFGATPADFVIPAIDPNMTVDQSLDDNPVLGASLSRNKSVPGRASATIPFGMYFVGSQSNYQVDNPILPPPWEDPFKACGMNSIVQGAAGTPPANTGYYVLLKEMDGEFEHLEPVSWPGTNNAGVVVGWSRPDTNGIGWMFLLTGALATSAPTTDDLITGGFAGVTAKASEPATINATIQRVPASEPSTQIKLGDDATPYTNFDPAKGDLLVKIDGSGNIIAGPNSATAFVRVNHTGPASGAMNVDTVIVNGTFTAGDAVAYVDISAGGTLVRRATSDPTVDTNGVTALILPSATIQELKPMLIKTMVGARGDFSLNITNGGVGRLDFNFQGQFDGQESGVLYGGTPATIINAPRFETALCTVDKYRFKVSTFTFAMNNTISLVPDVHASNGIFGSLITDRDPTITFEMDTQSPATWDAYAKLQGATDVQFYAQVGQDISNTMLVVASKCQLTSVEEIDRDGHHAMRLELKPRIVSGGDDEVEFYTL